MSLPASSFSSEQKGAVSLPVMDAKLKKTRKALLAPTSIAAHTKRRQHPSSCNCSDVLWFPFTIAAYICAGVLISIWFLASVMFGILVLPISPRWIFRFFRDLCNCRMSPNELDAVESELTEMVRESIKNSPVPTCPIHPHNFPHAVCHGTFTVEEGLSSDLRVGLFSRVNSYDAVVRFSGAAGPPDEFITGLHGMAVKINGVDASLGSGYAMWDDRAIRDERDRGIPGTRYDNGKVDIDFIGESAGTTFFGRSLREVLWVVKATANPLFGFYLPALGVLWSVLVTQPRVNRFLQENRGPLGWTYSSLLPYRFGHHIAKYYWVPDQVHAWQMPLRTVQYPCKKAIMDYLSTQPASYGLYVQFQPLPTDKNYSRFPIEDSSVEWSQKLAPIHRIGTLSLPPQNIDTYKRWYLSHTISYNPWNTFPEHQPVGSIGVARHRIYHMSLMERLNRLGVNATPTCPFMAKMLHDTQTVVPSQSSSSSSPSSPFPPAVLSATNIYCDKLKPGEQVPDLTIPPRTTSPLLASSVHNKDDTKSPSDSVALQITPSAALSSIAGVMSVSTLAQGPLTPAGIMASLTTASPTAAPSSPASTSSGNGTPLLNVSTTSLPSTPQTPASSRLIPRGANSPNRVAPAPHIEPTATTPPAAAAAAVAVMNVSAALTVRAPTVLPPLVKGTPIQVPRGFKLTPPSPITTTHRAAIGSDPHTGTPSPGSASSNRTALVYLE